MAKSQTATGRPSFDPVMVFRGGLLLLLGASIGFASYEALKYGASPFAHISACLAGDPPSGVFTVFGHCLWCWTGLAAVSALIASLPAPSKTR